MAIGINPTVDFAFKLMLGSPEHTGVTIHFLNSILDEQPRITQVEILNPFLGKNTEDDKLSVLDILATDEQGRMLNIEMQTTLALELKQRLAYHASCLYVGHQHLCVDAGIISEAPGPASGLSPAGKDRAIIDR